MTPPDRHVVVVGAGLAGLAAALQAAATGVRVTLLEQAPEPGGATAQSAGWIWRYASRSHARAFAPLGDPGVQRTIVERLDADLAWLASLGVRERSTSTGRGHTVGVQVDPAGAIDRLVARLQHLQPDALQVGAALERVHHDGEQLRVYVRGSRGASLGDEPVEQVDADAIVFAGGGYATDLDRIARECGVAEDARRAWVLRATRAGDGRSMDAATALGATRVPSDGESLVRLVPDLAGAVDRTWIVRAGELQVPGHRLVDADDRPIETARHDWSGAQAAWQLARSTGRGVLELPTDALLTRTHAGGTVGDVVREAIAGGCEGGRLSGGGAWIAVRAGITTTRCTLRVDDRARLLRPADARRRGRAPGVVVPGAFAAGADAACIGRGGMASGLAQALVLGRLAGAAAADRGRADADS